MKKLNYKIIDKLIENKCSRKEIDILLHIAQYQQENGKVYNFNYMQAVNHLQITAPTFYNCLYSLEQKGIIAISHSNKRGYRHIHILNNNYSNKDFDQKNYFNTHRPFLYTKEYQNCKATTKYLIFHLFRNPALNTTNGMKITSKKVAACIKIHKDNTRLMKKIIAEIEGLKVNGEPVFLIEHTTSKRGLLMWNIKLNNDSRITTIGTSTAPNGDSKVVHVQTELETVQRHMFKSFLKKHRIPFIEKDILDLIQMDNQYKESKVTHTFFIDKLSKTLTRDIYKLQAKANKTIEHVLKIVRTLVNPVAIRVAGGKFANLKGYCPLI